MEGPRRKPEANRGEKPGGETTRWIGRPAIEIWNRLRIVELLLRAGERAAALRDGLRYELKADASLVTQADREIEALLGKEFDRPREGVHLIGEETVAEKGEDYIREAFRRTAYIVDPIDGTSPYAHHLPNWGISIGRMEAGALTDGAVYLPDFRIIVVSEGKAVFQGHRSEGETVWRWREMAVPPVEKGPGGLIAITQEIAKSGQVRLPNPVQALGAAVVPLVKLLDGHFVAYVGSLRLWDVAGALPLLARLRFSMTRLRATPAARLDLAVSAENYVLDAGDPLRWSIRGGVLVCPPSEEARIRSGFEI